jgi:imidazolonepropionase-like amidohydrolase
VQAGRFADLVLLDANPLDDIANARRIHAVVLNGKGRSPAPQLDSMLTSVEVAVRPDAQVKLVAGSILGDTAMIAQGLAEGARIDSLAGGRRPLRWAALNNRGPAVRLLIARGAGLNLPQCHRIHSAASRGGGRRCRRAGDPHCVRGYHDH